jgi:hypothetical protein
MIKKYRCPECDGDDLLVYEETAFELNTMKYFCQTAKAHDSDANVRCTYSGCDWSGKRDDLGEPA